MRQSVLLAVLLAGFTAVGTVLLPGIIEPPRAQVAVTADPPAPATSAPPAPGPARPLAGVRIVIDPGHQLGNRNFPAEIGRLVHAGGFDKPCNTTGTASAAGFPEATFTWEVAQRLRRRLERLGAEIFLTRDRNSPAEWGPCVDARGAAGRRHRADLTVSLHADGAPAAANGFHVIVPESRVPWTSDIAAPSLRLGQDLRAGLVAQGVAKSSYIDNALDVRADLGTLNLSVVPIAMIEFGNMRNPGDAELMGSASGQDRYAAGVVAGIREYLGR